MKLPTLAVPNSSRYIVDVFKGYNHNLRVGTGEFYDMENMTGEYYPVLSPRAPRRCGVQTQGSVQGIACLDGLCYIDGGTVYYGDGLSLSLSLTDGEKQIVPFGAFLIILPDKLWVNTVTGETGSCERERQFACSVGVVWCSADGTAYETVVDGETAPENTAQMWLSGMTLMQWNDTLQEWVAVSPAYLKLIGDSVGADFDVGTKLCVEGDSDLQRILGTGENTVVARDRDFIVFEGSMEYTRWEGGTLQFYLVAKIPEMDFVFEHENRLWGCRYGPDNSGEFVNEIYASKLGDFTNWSSFQGVSTDSYIASCGTDGKWTGAVKALGYPLFFKENYLHKVYGSYPANYQMQVTPCEGVREGSEKSLCVIEGVLYYHSRGGVYAYDGSLPVCISEGFANVRYHSAVAGRLGSRYYVSMKDAQDAVSLFCYDTQKGFWHKEDDLSPLSFCTVADALYYTDGAQILCIGGQGDAAEEKVTWYAVTGLLGLSETEHKYIQRLTVRLSAEVGTRVHFFVQYDSAAWLHVGTFTGNGTDSVSVPIPVQRCDHLRLRIEGTGEAKIYSIGVIMAKGSELR